MRWAPLLLLVACDPDVAPPLPPPDPEAIHIGLLGPLSGPTAFLGFDFEKAARLAIQEINQAGGVNGRKLDLVLRDSRTAEHDAQAVSIASTEALAAAGCVAIVGPDASEVVLNVAPTLVARGLPLVSPTATSPAITGLADEGLIFRTAASDVMQAGVLAALLRDDGIARIAVIHRGDTYGNGLADALAGQFEARDGEVLIAVPYHDDQTGDFAAEVGRLFSRGTPDAVVVIGFVLDSAAVLTALHERGGAQPRLYGVDGNNDPGLLRNAPPQLLVGMRFTAPVSPEESQTYQDFHTAYTETLNEEPFRVEFTYDAVYLVALALVAAGANTPEAVRDHLTAVSRADGPDPLDIPAGTAGFALALANPGADLDFRGASGAIDFDGAGDVTRATFAIRQIIDSDAPEAINGMVFEEQDRIPVPEGLTPP